MKVLESVVTESVEFYTVSDEIRRWSSLSEGEYCLVMLGTKRDRWESTSQGRVICEHYWLSVLMYTPVMFDFTTEDRYWIEQENRLRFLFIEKENAFVFF